MLFYWTTSNVELAYLFRLFIICSLCSVCLTYCLRC